MADLKNKELFKVMWAYETEILWYAKTENALDLNCSLYKELENYIDIEGWKASYKEKYNNWLEDNDNSIYNIKDNLNMVMVSALININKGLKNEIVLYAHYLAKD
jgi:hypothetical protein